MPVACFLLFFVSEKLHRKYSRNCTEQKPSLLFSPTHTRSPKGRRRGATMPPHHVVARSHLWLCRDMVWGPRAPLTIVLQPIYSLRRENPKRIDHLPRKVPSRRHHRNQVSGVRRSCSGTLPGRGLTPGAISIDFTASTSTP